MIAAVTLMSFAALASYAQNIQQQGKPISVCQLLTHREDYNGRLVTVRGEVKGSSESAWLEADPDCNYKLITRGVVWPSIVSLAYPNSRSKDPMDKADFGVDWRAEESEGAVVRKLGFNPDKDHLFETFVGLFRTHLDLDKRVNPNKQDWPRFGFGHLGTAPAQILTKTRRDPVVVYGSPKKN
jgi:hypothetical protein